MKIFRIAWGFSAATLGLGFAESSIPAQRLFPEAWEHAGIQGSFASPVLQINVKDFGAAGDGTTYDAPAEQNFHRMSQRKFAFMEITLSRISWRVTFANISGSTIPTGRTDLSTRSFATGVKVMASALAQVPQFGRWPNFFP